MNTDRQELEKLALPCRKKEVLMDIVHLELDMTARPALSDLRGKAYTFSWHPFFFHYKEEALFVKLEGDETFALKFSLPADLDFLITLNNAGVYALITEPPLEIADPSDPTMVILECASGACIQLTEKENGLLSAFLRLYTQYQEDKEARLRHQRGALL